MPTQGFEPQVPGFEVRYASSFTTSARDSITYNKT